MMDPDQAFRWAGTGALLGWLLLAASLFAPSSWRPGLRRLGGRVVPALLSLGYVAALVTGMPDAPRQAGFGSLVQVADLFSVPTLLLAGWIHYLAFDLLVGRWQIDDGVAHGVANGWLLPGMVATFLIGPAGFLLYLLVRAISRRKGQPA